MASLRACPAFAVLVTTLLLPLSFAQAQPLDYKLGDVAREDVITPVPLLVVNPEATEALKQKVARQVLFVVRQTPSSAGEVEQGLRDSISVARTKFLVALQQTLIGRVPGEAEAEASAFANTVAAVAREVPKDLPLATLAPLWVSGASDESFIASLLRPVRSVMAQPIVSGKPENPMPANQDVRVLSMTSLSEPPTALELEREGQTMSAGKVITLWRARRLVEKHFPSGQEALGRYAATFVRFNAMPDPALTEILRAKRMDGVTANDSYEAAQVIVKKGQTIDRQTLSALAVLREKSLIGTLQSKIEQEKTIAGQIQQQTKWITVGLGSMALALILIFWRLRFRPTGPFEPEPAHPALPGSDQKALPGSAGEDAWRTRAIQAEGKAERAQEAIRTGALGWMRDKIFRSMFNQRAELLSVQQKAEAEMRELEQRLEQLHTPLRERIGAYEKRIEELEKELVAKGEENRELIGARISVAKQQLTVERERERGWFATS